MNENEFFDEKKGSLSMQWEWTWYPIPMKCEKTHSHQAGGNWFCKIQLLSYGLENAIQYSISVVISFNVILMQANGGSTETSGLGDVFDSHTSHLTVPHCTFLRHWDRLIDLEAREIEVHFWSHYVHFY